MQIRRLMFVLVGSLLGCDGQRSQTVIADGDEPPDAVGISVSDTGAAPAVSVASMDRATNPGASGDTSAPLEARILVVAASGSEPELGAIRSVLDHRGVPHDDFIATQQSALTADRLRSGGRGLYQGIILTTSSLAVSGTSTLSAAEWAVLADYEQAFAVRRAVLAAWPDPALGFG